MGDTFVKGQDILTVDLGNTSGSAVLAVATIGGRWDTAGEMVELGAWRASENEVDALAAAVRVARAKSPNLALAALSAVGSHGREAAALEGLRAAGLRVAVRPGAGLDLRIDHPETCGSDRLYAARGALELARRRDPVGDGAVLVVDVGTALTVDAAAPAAEDRFAGAFLGGAIALGPASLASSLVAAGARLPEFELDAGVPALGRSTHDALRAGVVVGFRGSVRELCGGVAREAHGSLGATTAFLTGGARDLARGAVVDLFGERVVEDPLLVHRGLAAAALGSDE